MKASIVVWDLGGVLLGWDPRRVYRSLLPSEAAVEAFLREVCSPAWNLEQDRGRTWAEGIRHLVDRFPAQESLIRAYRERWEAMISGPLPGMLDLVERMDAAGIPRYALTNFSAETFPLVRDRYAFFRGFRGIVVSAEEGLVKPDPALYQRLTERHGLDPADLVFVDDVPDNVAAARSCGWQAIHHQSAVQTAEALRTAGLEF